MRPPRPPRSPSGAHPRQASQHASPPFLRRGASLGPGRGGAVTAAVIRCRVPGSRSSREKRCSGAAADRVRGDARQHRALAARLAAAAAHWPPGLSISRPAQRPALARRPGAARAAPAVRRRREHVGGAVDGAPLDPASLTIDGLARARHARRAARRPSHARRLGRHAARHADALVLVRARRARESRRVRGPEPASCALPFPSSRFLEARAHGDRLSASSTGRTRCPSTSRPHVHRPHPRHEADRPGAVPRRTTASARRCRC